MSSRELVKRVLHHEEVDRIPIDYPGCIPTGLTNGRRCAASTRLMRAIPGSNMGLVQKAGYMLILH